jgi:hypothetical protein
MKRFLSLVTLCLFAACLHAQVVDTTVCDVLKNPAGFNGKMVRIKGTVSAGFDTFLVRDKICNSQINVLWVSYPEGTHGKAGPEATVELQPAKNFAGTFKPFAAPPVKMEKDKNFKDFDSFLSTPHKQARTCLGCNRYDVSATLVGRIDGVAEAKIDRDKSGKIVDIEGFGNLNAYPARLVLESVSDVTPKEVDYSKADAIVKSQPPDPADSVWNTAMNSVTNDNFGDAKASAHGAPNAVVDGLRTIDEVRGVAAKRFGADSPIAKAISRASGVYGKHEGVELLYGTPNEVSPKLEAQSSHDSPDGVIFNCTFNASRLQDEAMSAAAVHLGEHVADIRSPQPGVDLPTLYDKEYQGWVTTVLNVIAVEGRTLTLDGGYLLWNEFWTTAERDNNLDTAVSDYLRREDLITR